MTDSNVSSLSSEASGFIYAMDRQAARRHFHISLCVIVMLGIAIVMASLGLRSVESSAPGFAVLTADSIVAPRHPSGRI